MDGWNGWNGMSGDDDHDGDECDGTAVEAEVPGSTHSQQKRPGIGIDRIVLIDCLGSLPADN